MIHFIRCLIWKELYELARQPWILLGAFLVPLYFLYAASALVQDDAPLRVVITYSESEAEVAQIQIDQLRLIQGIVPVIVTESGSINEIMAKNEATVGILLSERAQPTMVERSATRFRRRLNLEVAARLNEELNGVDPQLAEALKSVIVAGGGVGTDLRHLSMLSGSDRRVFIPRGLALITLSVTIVLATRSMLREFENQTLPLLVTVPGGSWPLVILSKLVFVVGLSTTIFAFLLLTLQPIFDFSLKPGIPAIFGAQLLAVFATASVGISLPLLGRSTVQAYLLVSVYLTANLVLTGVISPLVALPLSGDSVLKLLLPLTFLRPIYEGWLFFGDPVGWRGTNLLALIAHALGGLALLSFAVKCQHERF